MKLARPSVGRCSSPDTNIVQVLHGTRWYRLMYGSLVYYNRQLGFARSTGSYHRLYGQLVNDMFMRYWPKGIFPKFIAQKRKLRNSLDCGVYFTAQKHQSGAYQTTPQN